MSSQLPPMPEQMRDEWDKYSLEDLRDETANLRHFVASLFLQVKDWTTRMNDLAGSAEQLLKLRGDDESKYIALSNKTNELDEGLKNSNNVLLSKLNELDENITLIMQALGLAEGDN